MPAESVHPVAEIQASTSFNSLPHSIPIVCSYELKWAGDSSIIVFVEL
ncbi:hypothetical protein GCM10011384_02610 [Psychrobacillus lasiicapitis]|nr:hypothetical protein GCM10011384_02610 [Psychrobacillus lasiicapitis]